MFNMSSTSGVFGFEFFFFAADITALGELSHPLPLMELQGDLVPKVSTAQRGRSNLCLVNQGHFLLQHMLLSARLVCPAGSVCLALCTCVQQVCYF